MCLSRNIKRQIIDVEIVQRFCGDCLGRKFVISTEREQKKGEKSSAESIHYTSLVSFFKMVLKHIDITIFLINISSIQKVKKKPSEKEKIIMQCTSTNPSTKLLIQKGDRICRRAVPCEICVLFKALIMILNAF